MKRFFFVRGKKRDQINLSTVMKTESAGSSNDTDDSDADQDWDEWLDSGYISSSTVTQAENSSVWQFSLMNKIMTYFVYFAHQCIFEGTCWDTNTRIYSIVDAHAYRNVFRERYTG